MTSKMGHKNILPVFLCRKSWEHKKMLYQEIQRRLRNFTWKFSKARRDLPLFAFQAVLGQVFGNQSKQTWLPCCSWWLLQGSFLNYQQKHQVLLNKALHDYFGECFCTRKHPVFTAVLHTQFHFRLIHCQLLFQFWF